MNITNTFVVSDAANQFTCLAHNGQELVVEVCHGDCNLRTYQLGQIVELKNKGFYIIDKIGVEDSTPYVLFNVPGTGGKVA